MIDHISLRVQDLPKALEFYKAALAPLGYEVLMEFPGTAGLGKGGMPDLWIMQTDKPVNPTHVAISGERSVIPAFHSAAVAAGGTDNGLPGLRPDYHAHYFAAFVLDPEGNNLEVVCHQPEGVAKPPAPAKPKRAPARKAAAKAPVAKAAARPAKKSLKASSAKKPAPKAMKKAMKKPGKAASKKRR
jgi:catechol 2,3-dioxygenase-like lactoylglutathione lyase family enzyme